MTKIRRNRRKLLIVLRIVFNLCLLGTVAFIFLNSAQNGENSGNLSLKIMELLNRITARLGLRFTFSHLLVRKLAHFAEYMMLGFWMMLTLRVYTWRLLSHISWPLFFGLLLPTLDESFQLLVPNRSGQLFDVLIDFAGSATGICIALFLLLISRAFWEELQRY